MYSGKDLTKSLTTDENVQHRFKGNVRTSRTSFPGKREQQPGFFCDILRFLVAGRENI